MEELSIIPYNNIFYCDIRNYYLPENQLMFTKTPYESINRRINDDSFCPMLIICDKNIIGFFVLDFSANEIREYTDNKNSVLLRSFSINFIYQGKGYGAKSLLKIKQYILYNYNYIDEIFIIVDIINNIAIKLYKKCNYVEEKIIEENILMRLRLK